MKKKSAIPAFSDKKNLVNVIVETHQGSRNKYSFDEETGLLMLKKVLPAGMSFPFDFGCIPGTLGEDGDPLDVMVLMEVAVCPPCIVEAHLIGVIEAEQTENGKTGRNDRLVAVASFGNKPAENPSVKKLSAETLDEIERFFISYNQLAGKKFKVLHYRGPKTAIKLVKHGEKAYAKKA